MRLINKNAIETVEYLAQKYDGEFNCSYGMASLNIHNKYAEGEIRAYETYSGVSSIVYNIKFHQDVFFERTEFSINPVYCLYCLKGHMFHKFEGDDEFNKLEPYQSFILAGNNRKLDITGFPEGEELNIVALFLLDTSDIDTDNRFPIRSDFREYIASIKEKTPFSDLVSISPKTALYVNNLTDNHETGVVGRLYNESAIMGILVSQFQSLSKLLDVEQESLPDSIAKKIWKTTHYLEKNLDKPSTIKELSIRSGLHTKQLQKGFKQLFGMTVGNFISTARLERSRELIETTDLNISEIIFRVGLSNRSYFSKIFSSKYGLTPSEYRKLDHSTSKHYELSYISTVAESTTDKDINEIIKTSRKRNQDLNLTGCLVYDQKKFHHILEGNKKNVLKVYNIIKEDPRHFDIRITWQGLRESRKFIKWSMAFIKTNKEHTTLIEGINVEIDYILTEDLNPSTNSQKFWDKIKSEL